MKLTPPEDTSVLKWAEFFISHGWAVFPVCGPDVIKTHPHGRSLCTPTHKDYAKAPFPGSRGVKDATTDLATFKRMADAWPGCNLAGTPPPEYFVADRDEATDFSFPATWTHYTGREDGRHYLYEQNPNNPVPQSQKPKFAFPGTDTKLSGIGYVVLPPSMHASGVRYRLDTESLDTVTMWPVELKPFAHLKAEVVVTPSTSPKASPEGTVLTALRLPANSPDAGDDAMITIAGYLARYLKDKEVFKAVLSIVNERWEDPLDDSAMGKKYSQHDRHWAKVATESVAASDAEAMGWLYVRPADEPRGLLTPIEDKRRSTIEYMAVTDFTMRARGVVVSPNYAKRIFIVDCELSDGTVLTGQKIDTDTMIDQPRFKKWLARRGMNTFDSSRDPRKGTLGQRMIKLLESQSPEQLAAREHYGWCNETQAMLTGQGEVTTAGLRPYTLVYPDDRLKTDAPTNFKFEADLATARDWLTRVLALQPERESAKVGAWAMMLMLRGQWAGLMPGLLVQASAGTGKTRYFQLLFKLLGSTNDGETLTDATLRDKLMANTSNAVWLDDCHLTEKQEQTMRTALTNGKITHKVQGLDGWETVEKQLRASIVVTGEGVAWYRQKAYRDRFIEAEFTNAIRSTDADKLATEDLTSASGALLVSVLTEASRLAELAALREGVTDRDDQARTTLRIGARVLDAVLGTGHKWTQAIDDWYWGFELGVENQGHASEGVLNVFPTLWRRHSNPLSPGRGIVQNAIYYDEVAHTFWVRLETLADEWNQTQRNLSMRERQMTSSAALEKELKVCGSPGAKNKYTVSVSGDRKGAKYWQLPREYSDMVLTHANFIQESDDNDNDE